LIGSVPSRNRRGQPLNQIPGMTPSLLNLPPGCAFRARCERATDECLGEPAVVEYDGNRRARCFHPYLEGAS
ncbi:MAG: methionine ABC transporter ATP-binding protein, partial [Gammaproteobacteria bacterium]|nr:methionine ABC transporter ATP-binding protein [Gammaproteobacteria bacterium]